MGSCVAAWEVLGAEHQRIQLTTSTKTVKQLSELLNQVKDEQSYIVVRERTHRNTAESTNGRVKWWSIFQLGVLLGEGIFQVWWLKRFFEVSPDIAKDWAVANEVFVTGQASCLILHRAARLPNNTLFL